MPKSLFWNGKTVVVVGGTSGLGLQLVLAAAAQGATLAIVGRDPIRLEETCRKAISAGATLAVGFSIDLREAQSEGGFQPIENSQIENFRAWLVTHEVHLLINAIGRSDRGPVEAVTTTELRSMLEDNLVCTWAAIQLTLNTLRRAKGTIVNISSLAGLIAAPNMGAYNASKAALTATTRQLRSELRPTNVHVMLVCTGPIAREDSGNRYADIVQKRGLDPASSNVPGGTAKLKLLDPVALSYQILHAASKRYCELVIPSKARWLGAIMLLWPTLGDWVLSKYLKKKA